MAVGGIGPADDLVAIRVLEGGVREGEAQLAEEAVTEVSGGDGGGGGARCGSQEVAGAYLRSVDQVGCVFAVLGEE